MTFTNKLVKSLWKSQQAGGSNEEVSVKRNCFTPLYQPTTTPFWKRVVHANVQSLPDWLAERRYKSLQMHYCVPRGFGKKVQLCLLSPFRCTDTRTHTNACGEAWTGEWNWRTLGQVNQIIGDWENWIIIIMLLDGDAWWIKLRAHNMDNVVWFEFLWIWSIIYLFSNLVQFYLVCYDFHKRYTFSAM